MELVDNGSQDAIETKAGLGFVNYEQRKQVGNCRSAKSHGASKYSSMSLRSLNLLVRMNNVWKMPMGGWTHPICYDGSTLLLEEWHVLATNEHGGEDA